MRYLILICLLATTLATQAATDKPFPIDQNLAQIEARMAAARQRAIGEGKLVMVVLGANWCHDSIAFAERSKEGALGRLIDDRYVKLYIGIDEFKYVREVITAYDEPVIYGTPTVLVVEPESDELLNRHSLAYWRDASLISMEDSVAYFDAYHPGQQPAAAAPASARVAAALAEIDAFEEQQAERIYRAYDELTAMIAAAPEGDYDAGFRSKWDSLAQMRAKITGDLQRLRASAREQAGSGTSAIALEFPSYPLFIDEAPKAE